MPNILVYIDVRDGLPTSAALFSVSEARRIARLAGASIFAVLLSPQLRTQDLDALARPIAGAGADKLLLCEGEHFAGPPLDATHGGGLDAAVARVLPMLVLFPAGGADVALGPSLAARLGGPFAPWCDFLTTEGEVAAAEGSGRVQLIRCRPDGRSGRRLDPLEIERPIVATLGAGRRPPPVGRIQDLEVEVISIVQPLADAPPVALSRTPAPYGDLPLASVLVLVGARPDGGAPVIDVDALRAALAPGMAVEPAGQVPASVLAVCCPDILIKVGQSTGCTARSPRSRVVLIAVPTADAGAPAAVVPGAAPAEPDARQADLPGGVDTVSTGAELDGNEEVDVIWQFQSWAQVTASVVASLLRDLEQPA